MYLAFFLSFLFGNLYYVFFILFCCIPYSLFGPLYFALNILHSFFCMIYSVSCMSYSIFWILYYVFCIFHSVFWTLECVQFLFSCKVHDLDIRRNTVKLEPIYLFPFLPRVKIFQDTNSEYSTQILYLQFDLSDGYEASLYHMDEMNFKTLTKTLTKTPTRDQRKPGIWV